MRVFDETHLLPKDLDEIVSFLGAGGVIGLPTETAYGLAADPFNESAVRRIFELKGRPEAKPILLLVNSVEMLLQVAELPDQVQGLIQRFWPGPLTIVLPAAAGVPDIVTAGTRTVGVRWPKAPFVSRLTTAFGRPVTGTSANRSGMPASISAGEVRSQFGDELKMLVDGGTLNIPGGSTVLDLTAGAPLLLREGPIGFKELNEFFNGRVQRGE